MKTLLVTFLLVSSGLCQQTGSIFTTINDTQIVNDDPTDSSQVKNTAAPSLTSSTPTTSGSDQVTQNSKADPNGEDDKIPTGDVSLPDPQQSTLSNQTLSGNETQNETSTESPQTQQFTEENSELTQENQALENQVLSTLAELEYYRLLEAQILQDYANQMKNLTTQIALEKNDFSTQESSASTTSLTTTSVKHEDDDDDDDDEYSSEDVSLIMIAAIGLGFLFLLLHSVRNMWLEFPASEMYQGVYTLLVDSTMLVLIWCILALLEYWEVFDLDVFTILVGLVIFTFFWMVLGLWVLFLVNLQSDKWRRSEKKLSLALDRSEEDVQYFIMRQLFITPVYIAPVTENELSPSFDFSVYLSKCLGQVVQNSLRITWVGYGLILLCILLWRTIASQSEDLEIILLWVLPGIIFFVILLFLFKLHRVYLSLVPNQAQGEIQISLSKHLSEEKIRTMVPKPKYLKGKIEDVECRFLCVKFNPFKLTCAYLFLNRFPNRHELVFWFDSYGPNFIIILIQAISVLHTLWMTAIILYYFPVFIDEMDTYGILFVILGIVVWVLNGFLLLPKLFISLSLTSKIELMKERSLIEETVEHTKKQIIDKTVKIYRQLKMIYREVKGMDEGEEKGEILDCMKEVAEEVFLLFADQDKVIHATQLDDVLSLIGIRLREDELRLFAKECSPDKDNFVTLKGFLMAIERILYGFEINPGEVVKYVLLNYFKKVRKMTMADLTEFFDEWSWHFNEDILQDFLMESETLADEQGMFRIQDFGNMVKIHVESLPK